MALAYRKCSTVFGERRLRLGRDAAAAVATSSVACRLRSARAPGEPSLRLELFRKNDRRCRAKVMLDPSLGSLPGQKLGTSNANSLGPSFGVSKEKALGTSGGTSIGGVLQTRHGASVETIFGAANGSSVGFSMEVTLGIRDGTKLGLSVGASLCCRLRSLGHELDRSVGSWHGSCDSTLLGRSSSPATNKPMSTLSTRWYRRSGCRSRDLSMSWAHFLLGQHISGNERIQWRRNAAIPSHGPIRVVLRYRSDDRDGNEGKTPPKPPGSNGCGGSPAKGAGAAPKNSLGNENADGPLKGDDSGRNKDNDAAPNALAVAGGSDGRDSQVAAILDQMRTIPNLITASRIISAPLLSYLIVAEEYKLAIGGCFVFALTDWLDGYIARNYEGQATVLGTYLDPLADKVLVNVLSASLWYTSLLPGPIVALWLARDVGLVVTSYVFIANRTEGGGAVANPARTPLKVQPTLVSRVNTALQFATIAAGMAQPLCGLPGDAVLGLCWITAGTTVASGLSYVGGHSMISSGNESSRKGGL